jgi:hypothetical protein
MLIEVIRTPATAAELLTEFSPYELGARRLMSGGSLFAANPTLVNIVTTECRTQMFMLALLELKWRDNLPMGLPVDFASAVGRIKLKRMLDRSDLEAVIAGYASLRSHLRFLVDMRYMSATEVVTR